MPGSIRFWVSFGFTLLFLAFLTILDYPFLARLYNEQNQGEVVLSYEGQVEQLPDEEQQEMLRASSAYNEKLASGLWGGIGETEEALHEEYEALLDTGGGIMGRIEIPKLHVDLAIYHGTSEEALSQGAGHLEGSSLPVGGESTHASISAHRGLVTKKMFTNLDELEEGDFFILHVLGEDLYYQVGEIYTILPEEVEELTIRRGEDLVTLITCTPYGINTHRLCVEGHRIEHTEEVDNRIQEETKQFRWQDWWWVYLSAGLLLLMVYLLWRYNRKYKEVRGMS